MSQFAKGGHTKELQQRYYDHCVVLANVNEPGDMHAVDLALLAN